MMDQYGADPGITHGSSPPDAVKWWSQNCGNENLCWELRRKFGISPGVSFGSTPDNYQTIWKRECGPTSANR